MARLSAGCPARLGTLTREYKVIRGEELISLGIRDCSAPRDEIMMAKVRPVSPPTGAAGSVVASLGDRLASFVTPSQSPLLVRTNRVDAMPASEPGRDAGRPESEVKLVPEPPPRPADLGPSIGIEMDVPMPPRRPAMLAIAEPMFRRPISGSQPILQPAFVVASLR